MNCKVLYLECITILWFQVIILMSSSVVGEKWTEREAKKERKTRGWKCVSNKLRIGACTDWGVWDNDNVDGCPKYLFNSYNSHTS